MKKVIEMLEENRAKAKSNAVSLRKDFEAAEEDVHDFNQAITLLKDFMASQ